MLQEQTMYGGNQLILFLIKQNKNILPKKMKSNYKFTDKRIIIKKSDFKNKERKKQQNKQTQKIHITISETRHRKEMKANCGLCMEKTKIIINIFYFI